MRVPGHPRVRCRPSRPRRDGPHAGRRERGLAHSSRLPPRARRHAGLCRPGRDDVPRRDPAHGRRVHGGRCILRPLGLPHHLASPRRMAPGTDDQARGVLGPPGPPPAPGAPPHAALRGVLRVRDRPQGHLRGVAARCSGHPSLREQLAFHSRQLQLLQRDVGFLAPAAHLVTGGGGAVLRDLAAGRARGHALHPQPARPVRPLLRGRHRVGSLDASRVRRRRQHQPRLSRDRHALAVPLHRLRAGRGTRAPHAATGTKQAGWPRGSCGGRRARPGCCSVACWASSGQRAPSRCGC